MDFNKLSPLAQSLWSTLNELEPVVHLTISEMAYESANDQVLSDAKRRAYMEVWHFSIQDFF